MANSVYFVQPAEASCSQGSSPRAFVELGKRKDYELVAATQLNLLFVDRQYFPAFDIPDNSLELIRDDSGGPRIFVLYDGTVVIGEGNQDGWISLPWHYGLKLRQRRVQVVPNGLRRYPPAMTRVRRALYLVWLCLHRPLRTRDFPAAWRFFRRTG
jgi:hypothetical protein